MTKRAWLVAVDWTIVAEINRQLCAPRKAQYGPTSDGHESARRLWAEMHSQPLDLRELAELCYRCHRLAPFLNYNGNTFVAIARQVISSMSLPPGEAPVLRTLIGHIIAGTAEPHEQEQFLQLLKTQSERRP